MRQWTLAPRHVKHSLMALPTLMMMTLLMLGCQINNSYIGLLASRASGASKLSVVKGGLWQRHGRPAWSVTEIISSCTADYRTWTCSWKINVSENESIDHLFNNRLDRETSLVTFNFSTTNPMDPSREASDSLAFSSSVRENVCNNSEKAKKSCFWIFKNT